MLFSSLQASSVTIISNKNVEATALTTAQLRRIYSMRQTRWHNDTPIVVFTLPSSHPLHQRFTKDHLNIFPYQLDSLWSKLTFSGLGVAPQKINTISEMINAVANTPGAIGYVDDTKEVVDVQIITMEK